MIVVVDDNVDQRSVAVSFAASKTGPHRSTLVAVKPVFPLRCAFRLLLEAWSAHPRLYPTTGFERCLKLWPFGLNVTMEVAF